LRRDGTGLLVAEKAMTAAAVETNLFVKKFSVINSRP
jgi:hypothetical protein